MVAIEMVGTGTEGDITGVYVVVFPTCSHVSFNHFRAG